MGFSQCGNIIERLCAKRKIHELITLIENADGSISWNKGYNRNVDSPMLMAVLQNYL